MQLSQHFCKILWRKLRLRGSFKDRETWGRNRQSSLRNRILLLHSLTHSEGQHSSFRLRGSKLQKWSPNLIPRARLLWWWKRALGTRLMNTIPTWFSLLLGRLFRTFYTYDAVQINQSWLGNNTAVIFRPKPSKTIYYFNWNIWHQMSWRMSSYHRNISKLAF